MAIAKNKTNYPLEQVISIFSNKEYGNSFNLSKNKYLSVKEIRWCPKKYADIKRQANNDISIVQNFLLKQRNLANLNY